MPNQSNFRSDVTTKTDVTYLASRIVRVPTEEVFLEQVPGSFGFDAEDNIEIHFYTISDNQLQLSTTVTLNEDILKFHIVSYADGTNKTYIRIDFTKLLIDKQLVLIPGDYRMVLNFFSDEIGDYTNRKLSIINISDSRSEVELTFNDSIDDVTTLENRRLLKEFVDKSFTKMDAVGVAEKIFTFGVKFDNSEEGATSTNVINNIESTPEEQITDNTIRRMERLGLRTIFEDQLDSFITTLYPKIREKIVLGGDMRIQEDEFEQFIQSTVKEQISNLNQIVDARIKVR